jgi:CHAD domain-containing protein
MSGISMELDYVKLKQVKPAIAGYIRKSQVLLKKSDIPDEKAIHDIRVLMKKSRSLLKLSAHQTDNPYYSRNIADLRETGRTLCSWRENSVYRKILKELKKEFPDIFSQLRENSILNLLLEKPKFMDEHPEEIRAALGHIEILLNKTGSRLRFQSMNRIDPQILIKELDVTYKKVSEIYLRCRNNPKPETIHKFRQKSKDFLYQLYIFRPLNPSLIKTLEKKLETMTLNLGKFNDLAQMIKVLGYKYRKGTNPPPMDELILKIRDKQDRYLNKVWTPAFQIFCPGQKLVNLLGFKLLVI